MKFTIKKNLRLSGAQASIYTIFNEEDKETSLEQFYRENIENFREEVSDIFQRLKTIGHKHGARIGYFKENEGTDGDGICALYDNPKSNLRLYCIRNGSCNVILGGGGNKPKDKRRYQEVPKLNEEVDFLKSVSNLFLKRVVAKEIRYTNDGLDLEGDLTFEEEDL